MKKSIFVITLASYLVVACSSGGGSNAPEREIMTTVPPAPTTPAAVAAAQSSLQAAAAASAAMSSANDATSAATTASTAATTAQSVAPNDPATAAVVSAANTANAAATTAVAASSTAQSQALAADIAAQSSFYVQDQFNQKDQVAAQAQADLAAQAAKEAAAAAEAAAKAAKDAAAANQTALQALPVEVAAAISSNAAAASSAEASASATAAATDATAAAASATAAQAAAASAAETKAAADAAAAAQAAAAQAAAAEAEAQKQAAEAQAAAAKALADAKALQEAQAQAAAAIAEQAAKDAATQALLAEQAAKEAQLAKDAAAQALAQLTGVAPVSNCNENFIPKTGLVPATAGPLGTDIKDPIVAKKLLDDMVVKYEDFIERNECDNWFYFPDDPREMTAVDKARFLDPKVWPVEFEFSDDFPPETLETFRRNLNMMRYIIHTKAYAHILKDYILMDRGQIVDYREALLAIRTLKAKVAIKPSTDFYDGNWYAVVRGSVVKGVRVPLAANIPSNFDPTFGLTDASISASRSMIGPPSVGFRRKDATVLDKDITVLGFGADAMGPNRAWYNKGFHIWIFQLLPHEILHVVGYTHSGLDKDNTSLWTDVTKDGRVIKDVNYALGPAIDKLAGYYYKSWWTNTTMRNYTFVPSFPIFDVPTFYSATKTPVDRFGNPKAWYLTTDDLIFPMNYYGAPYITKASAITDGLERNLNDVAYDVNNIKGDTWKLYPKQSKYINWDCNFKDSSGKPLDCQGTPNSSGYSSSIYRTFPISPINYFGKPAYVRTTAMWTMSTPKNAGPGLVN